MDLELMDTCCTLAP